MSYDRNDDNLSDLDAEVEAATISFVPQVGSGNNNRNKNKNKNRSHDHQNPPPPPNLGYGVPPPPMAAPGGGYNINDPNAPGPHNNYGDIAPSSSYQQQPPNKAFDPYNNAQQQQPFQQQQIMMGQPVMMMPPSHGGGAGGVPPGMEYYAFNGVPNHHHHPQQQTGAMILLVQESHDLDFRAPLCAINSCMQCVNAWFLPYCLLARQQNMLSRAPVDSYRVGPPVQGMPSQMDTRKVDEARKNVKDWNGCCIAAAVFDVARLAAAYFLPQIAGSVICVNGLCVQTLQTRQAVRARFGIAPSQFSDILVSTCCSLCATMQQSEELRMRQFDCGLTCGMDSRPAPGRMH